MKQPTPEICGSTSHTVDLTVAQAFFFSFFWNVQLVGRLIPVTLRIVWRCHHATYRSFKSLTCLWSLLSIPVLPASRCKRISHAILLSVTCTLLSVHHSSACLSVCVSREPSRVLVVLVWIRLIVIANDCIYCSFLPQLSLPKADINKLVLYIRVISLISHVSQPELV